MFISPSMLERLYVRGSLKNTEKGFEFRLKNNVDSGTISGIKSITIDGAEAPLANFSVKTPAGERCAEEISARSPLYLRYGAEMEIWVGGAPLAAGEHTIVLTIMVLEMGRMEIKIKDEVAANGL